MIYCISDIHGHYKLFLSMLEKIQFSSEDFLFILGDVVDRGPEGIKLLMHCLENPNIHLLLGNHELMMRDSLTPKNKFLYKTGFSQRDYFDLWMSNGGENDYLGFVNLDSRSKYILLSYLWSLPLYYELTVGHTKYLLVHAGLDCSLKLPEETIYELMKKQTKFHDLSAVSCDSMYSDTNVVWIRKQFILNPALSTHTVIFGHTPTIYFKGSSARIWYDETYKDKIGLDCGVFRSGVLSALCLNTMQEYYVD